jgi:DNA gyrase subunit A
VRTRVDEISTLGRNTQGVTLIRVLEDEKLVSIERIQEPEDVPEFEEDDGNRVDPMDVSVADESSVVDAADDELPADDESPEA